MLEQQIVGFLDPSSSPGVPGWPLRNLLAYLRVLYPYQSSRLRILCWRESEQPTEGMQIIVALE
jgi:ubiquitin-like modifier-activating enzyme ATG7